jgi:hypothetical protein
VPRFSVLFQFIGSRAKLPPLAAQHFGQMTCLFAIAENTSLLMSLAQSLRVRLTYRIFQLQIALNDVVNIARR